MESAAPLSSSRAAFARWALPATMAVACAVLACASTSDERWHHVLDYTRAGVSAGEAWRLWTGHFMHVSTAHAVLDITGLLLVAWIFGDELGARRQAIATLLGIASVDAGLWFFHPEVDRYAGLSGLLHAWFVAGAMAWALSPRDARSAPSLFRRRAWGAALLAGVVVKLMLEDRQGTFWLHDAQFAVVTAAHRWGAVAGAICGVAFAVLRRRGSAGRAGVSSRNR